MVTDTEHSQLEIMHKGTWNTQAVRNLPHCQISI